jgi:hypothetical protein
MVQGVLCTHEALSLNPSPPLKKQICLKNIYVISASQIPEIRTVLPTEDRKRQSGKHLRTYNAPVGHSLCSEFVNIRKFGELLCAQL